MSDDELRMITGSEGDEQLAEAYGHVANCPCHGEHKSSPKANKLWDVPQKPGENGPRYAIIAVED